LSKSSHIFTVSVILSNFGYKIESFVERKAANSNLTRYIAEDLI